MNKKTFIVCLVVFIASALLAISVSAEDLTIDVSSAVESNGKYGQSVRIDTPEQDEKFRENFDPCTMTKNSVVIAEYTLNDDYDGSVSPVELIFQTWKGGPQERNPHVLKEWNKVTPYEFNATKAYFSYDDIVAAWGVEDFSTCYAVYIGDTGYRVTVTSMKVTEIDPSKSFLLANSGAAEDSGEEEAQETEASVVTEAVTTYETGKTTLGTPAETKVTADPAEQARRIAEAAPKTGTGAGIVIAVIIVAVIAGGGAGVYIWLKRNGRI